MLRIENLETRWMPAVLTVNTDADTNINADGVLSLREAADVVNSGDASGLDGVAQLQIDESTNPLGTDDRIQFSSTLQDETIVLSLGELAITNDVQICRIGLGSVDY